MTAADLLADLARRGFRLAAEGDGIRIRPRLPDELRQLVLRHKAELLALLPAPWDSAAADALVAEVQRRRRPFGEAGWPEGPAACRRLAEQMDRFDAHWLARDLAGLRRAADDLLTLLPATPADLPADWRDTWEERAAVRQFDGGLPREESEVLALADVLGQMVTPDAVPSTAEGEAAPGT